MRNYKKIEEYLETVYNYSKPFNFNTFEAQLDFDKSMSDADYVKKYVVFSVDNINEDTAAVTAGNVSGMGAVVTSQPSSIPGDTAGATTGSGDIGAVDLGKSFGFNRNIRSRDNLLPRNRRKSKAVNVIKSMKKDKSNNLSNIITKFDDFKNK